MENETKMLFIPRIERMKKNPEIFASKEINFLRLVFFFFFLCLTIFILEMHVFKILSQTLFSLKKKWFNRCLKQIFSYLRPRD